MLIIIYDKLLNIIVSMHQINHSFNIMQLFSLINSNLNVIGHLDNQTKLADVFFQNYPESKALAEFFHRSYKYIYIYIYIYIKPIKT